LQHKPGALLPILHAIQNAAGYVPKTSLKPIADALNLSLAEVDGVVSFYHYFCTSRSGAHRVQICRAEACQAMGSRALEAHAKQSLGIGFGETTPDQLITLEPVYCLGNCACSPSVRIDNAVHGRVDRHQFDDLMHELRTQVIEVR